MLQYQRYIFRHLFITFGIILLGLSAIVWLMQALRLVEFIVNQGVPIGLFLKLSLLLLPTMMLMVTPIALTVAIVFFYHRLRTDSELVVLHSTGLSKWQLAMPAISVGLLASLMAFVVSFILSPMTMREFNEMRFYLRNNYVSVLLQEGVFSTPIGGLTVYVRERVSDKMFRGVMVHDNRNPKASVTMMAEQADLQATDEGPQFILYRGNRQELRSGALSFLQFDRYVLDISVYTKGTRAQKENLEEFSVPELLTRPPDGYSDPKQYRQAIAAGHLRIMWPILPSCLTLMAIGFMLSGEFNRRQRWRRHVLVATVTTVAMVSLVAMRGLIVQHFGAIPLGYVVVLFPAILGCIALWPRKFRLSDSIAAG